MSKPETLLICTVGGTPEPIVAALKHWRPLRIVFVHTRDTKPIVGERIVPKAREEGVDIDSGRYDLHELSNEQDFSNCVANLQPLHDVVYKWMDGGSDRQVVVDITGGTKCMSAAMAIQATRWPCLFSYVGGTERTKDGVGIVVSGKELLYHTQNPWDALGHQAVEDFIVLFDQHAYRAAAKVAEDAKKRMTDPVRKSELSSLEQLAKALDDWDRFEHKRCKQTLEGVKKSANNLLAALGKVKGERVLANVNILYEHLEKMSSAQAPHLCYVVDLLANAKRRKDEGRFDDAVARLYRAIEAYAQCVLKEKYGIERTDQIPLEMIPEPLKASWSARAIDGCVKLGLQDDYRLLEALGDPVGQRFVDIGLSSDKSPLGIRNRSILAHGFTPVSYNAFEDLWKKTLALVDIDESKLPSFACIEPIE
jgi:CRISPR-associated protein (TIGR02710 family)